ncbi:hypothetical protein [Nonomuraea sp. NEAU-A123]|uniref:hypothetical protein n=1 Tax=Nonomuraea sp. NEAU-A123 TaxID=2839649 RepID=UPI001BE4C8A2|nr:hypothetical protein [Nonomuraea sp. NEAU-A123]MBT2227093.1 hypothetical protein [Nonomuraea sp. NEAU-A123]
MTRARSLAAAGALAAFVAGGVSMAAGIGTASAATRDEPNTAATCLLPILPCEVQPSLGVPDLPIPNPLDSWSSAPAPDDSWSPPPGEPEPSKEPDRPWKPVDEEEHRMPQGHPETGAGGLVPEPPVWPFAAGGVALLAGAGLTGFAVRRGKGEDDAARMAQAGLR